MAAEAPNPNADNTENRKDFIRDIIDEHNRTGRFNQRVHTRFPPEPNGYLHIGHAKSICLNYGIAKQYRGKFNLRFDDTNPAKEEQEYVDSIITDVRWLGADYEDRLLYASDYFEQMYQWALELIKKGKAYVCDLTGEQTREYRGTLTEPGKNSPYRDRSPEESLDLFQRMRAGEFPDGSRTLRAKIDMTSPNLNLRDPVMYRIVHADHHRQGAAWNIYPMYDWAHGLEDSIEGITHSICTLEFENHRPLYDWFINAINEGRGDNSEWGPPIHHPQQIEFARLNLNYTVMSKRKLLTLVKENHVGGWDDPRMPTISGLRRRGYTPASIRNFCADIGTAKFNSIIDVARLENAVRDHLNKVAPRIMAVIDPIKVVIENWADGGDPDRVEWIEAVNNPEDPDAGTRQVPFSRELYIERDDFMEDPPRKFFRLGPGREVRLRYGYWITCHSFTKNDAGEITELRCTYDPQTKGGDAPPPDADGNQRKVRGTLHWVSAAHAVPCEVRLFDRLFNVEKPEKISRTQEKRGVDFLSNLNPDSLRKVTHAVLEPNWRDARGPDWPDGITRLQFERNGYFCLDRETTADLPVFNRTVTLKDTWSKIQKRG